MNSRPVFQLTLHPTYYKLGFFNVPRDFDRYVRSDDGPVTLTLSSQFHEIGAWANRRANRNGTARIMGGARLRLWFQGRYREMDTVPVRFDSLDRLVLG